VRERKKERKREQENEGERRGVVIERKREHIYI
jgi:hypothetical protein